MCVTSGNQTTFDVGVKGVTADILFAPGGQRVATERCARHPQPIPQRKTVWNHPHVREGTSRGGTDTTRPQLTAAHSPVQPMKVVEGPSDPINSTCSRPIIGSH